MTSTTTDGQPVGDPVDWTQARPPAPVVLSGRHAVLRPLAPEDAGEVVSVLGSHADLWTYQSTEAPTDVDGARSGILALPRPPSGQPFAVTDPATGDLLGRACLMRADPVMGTIEVGAIVYSPALQRTRAATEVQLLLAEHVFDVLGYRRYEWKCDSLNAPSRAAATRLGFLEEGTWRQALVLKGRNRDTTWFAMTDGDWPLVREALRTWLDDDNHDEDGRQQRSLAEVREALQ